MKEKQKIRWEQSIGYNRTKTLVIENRMTFLSELILDVVCALIFMQAAKIILSDVYYWGEYGGSNFVLMILVAALISGAMEAAAYFGKRLETLVRLGVLVLSVILFVLYTFSGDNMVILNSGASKIISIYVKDWNEYYGTTLATYGGSLMDIPDILDFVMLAILVIFLWISKVVKNRLVMVVVPIAFLVLELLVGYSPEIWGLILMFVGVLMSNADRWKKADVSLMSKSRGISSGYVQIFSWAIVGVCALVLCIIIGIVGMSSAENAVDYADEVKKFHVEIIEKVKTLSFENFFDWDTSFEFGNGDSSEEEKITNKKPSYKQVTVLNVVVSEKPYENMYLRGFYGNVYKDGVWKTDTKNFENACENKGYDVDEISESIATLGVSKIEKKYSADSLEEAGFANSTTIVYEDLKTKKAFVPYFFNEDEASVNVEGENIYTKKKSDEELNFDMWRFEGRYEERLGTFGNASVYEWETWYEKYVMQNYIDVPADMDNVRAIADELNADASLKSQTDSENQNRLDKAYLVAKWMQKNTIYSMNLPELPSDTDPIEYFLGESKKGYCKHYASASVMILRAMNVPARLATGYIVTKASFDETSDGYEALVKDSDAHAWVEIYLNGVGWVPYEVTKGFNESVIQSETSERQTSNSGGINNPTTSPNVNPTNSTEPTNPTTTDKNEVETTKQQPTTSEKTTTKPKSTKSNNEIPSYEKDGVIIYGENPEETNYYGDDDEKVEAFMKFLGYAVIVIGILIFVYFKIKEKYYKALMWYINNKHTLRAIKVINRRLYKKIRLTNVAFKGNFTDENYGELLKKNYPNIPSYEWDRYMDIVKAAAFSKRDFSTKEMEFCYFMYRKVTNE